MTAAKLPADWPSTSATVMSIAEFAERSKERRASFGGGRTRSTARTIERDKAQMEIMAARADWTDARGTHLVALYAWLHESVYGVATAELDPQAWDQAAAAADRMIASHFEKDAGRAVLFLRWTWKREQGREAYRKERGTGGGRIGWRLQFGPSLMTDYKVDQARGRR